MKLWIDSGTLQSASKIRFQVSNVLNWLYSSKIKDYSFSLTFSNDVNLPDEEQWNAEMLKIAERNQSRFEVNYSRRNLLISRKDSKIAGCIQGYMLDGWLMYHHAE